MTKPQSVKTDKSITADPDDNTLMVRVQAGDHEAFSILVDRYTGLIYSITYRLCRNNAKAEELAQESFIILWTKSDQWDESKGSVKSWLCRIAHNKTIDLLRKADQKATKISTDDIGFMLKDEKKDAEDQLSEQDAERVVAGAMEQLPETQKAALQLFHFEDMSVRDVAEIMDTTEKAVESLLYRGRKTLHEVLAPYKQYEII